MEVSLEQTKQKKQIGFLLHPLAHLANSKRLKNTNRNKATNDND